MSRLIDTVVASLPPLNAAALFLDFDGTLVDLAPRPDAIVVDAGLGDLLASLLRRLDGAVALVSGRSVDDLRNHVPGFAGIIVGGHGAEWRIESAIEPRVRVDRDALATMTELAQGFVAGHCGLLLERKPTGLVLHYRAAPERAAQVADMAETLGERHPSFETHAAKMAIELRPRGVGKDKALADLMARSAFAARTPVMFGDDTTDEPAMAWAQAQGGVGVKVGEGASTARVRLDAPGDVHAALRHWARKEETNR